MSIWTINTLSEYLSYFFGKSGNDYDISEEDRGPGTPSKSTGTWAFRWEVGEWRKKEKFMCRDKLPRYQKTRQLGGRGGGCCGFILQGKQERKGLPKSTDFGYKNWMPLCKLGPYLLRACSVSSTFINRIILTMAV